MLISSPKVPAPFAAVVPSFWTGTDPPLSAAKARSGLKIGRDLALDILDRHASTEFLPIDEERRGRVDAELGRRALAYRFDALGDLLVLQAGLETLLSYAGLPG